MAQNLQSKIKDIFVRMNAHGIPLPVLRDPVTKLPSVTLTFTVLSFNVALLGLLGKVADAFKGIDVQQANYLFVASACLYLGRKMTGKDITVEKKDDKNE